MSWPAGLSSKPLVQAEVDQAVACLNAIAAADNSGEYVTRADVEDSLASAEHTLGVWHEDQLVAYAMVMHPDDDTGLTIVEQKGGVHPDHRRGGIGGPLLDWINHRPAQAIETEIQASNEGALTLFRSRGYQPIRYFSVMQRPYDATPIPAGPVPPGFDLIPFDPAYDESLRLAHNEIFQDHWRSHPKSEADWQKWFTGRSVFRPGLSYLVLDGDRIAAYTLAYEFDVDTEQTGVRELWAGQVGTRREYRGRGLARAALTAVLRAGAAAGFERSGLGVDADSPTGAFRLYEHLGYRNISSKILHQLATNLGRHG